MEPAWTLRSMEPTDGPAMDELLRSEPTSGRFRISTHYLVDVYQALITQHPDIIGVVAESRDREGLVGMATAFFGDVRLSGAVRPSAHLENLKVHHDLRRRGIGKALAGWRIAEARRRNGADGVVIAHVEASNVASLATAATWSTQVLGPVSIVIGRTATREPRLDGLEVRPPTEDDLEEAVSGMERYHAEHVLYPPQTIEGLASALGPSGLGEPIRQYRIAVAPDGSIVAGTAVTERYRLMVDRVDGVPILLRMLGRITGQLPPDGMIRSIELSLVWHAPNREDAARSLWDAIRWEWRDRCTSVAALVDPRTTLARVVRPGRGPGPRPRLMVPVRSPDRIDPARPVYLWR